jgi:D-aminopeptidase
VVDPGGDIFRSPTPFGAVALNGAGEMTGFVAASEWGLLETPIFLTSTMQLGRVYDAACRLLMADYPVIGDEEVIIPVVTECDDSFLNESRAMQVEPDDVAAAFAAARASVGSAVPPDEGAVGSGTGMSCLGFKGGIGTSSRTVPSGHTVGVLVMSNFGEFGRLTIDGIPVGRLIPDPSEAEPDVASDPGPKGSCIVVVGTEAPVDHSGCERLARRAGMGLARTGSTAHHGSGEIFMAFATGLRGTRGSSTGVAEITGRELDPFFEAVIDATEEAVLNSMLMAPTVTGRKGNTMYGLDADVVTTLLAQARSGR